MKIYLFIAFFCLKLTENAQTDVIKLWPAAVPGEILPKHEPEEYTANKSGVNINRITNVTDPKLQVFRPGKNVNGAAIIICAGGGNKYLAINIEGEEVAEYFSKKGFLTFALEYSVPLKTLGSFQDIQRAIKLIRMKAKEFKINTDQIGVMGFSAGGNLAARATTGFDIKSYEPVDNVDTISCRPGFSLLIYPGSLTTTAGKLIPEVNPNDKTPPVFVFVAADDQYKVPFTLGQALLEEKVLFEFHVFLLGGQGYGLRKGNKAAEVWPSLAENWINNFILQKK